MNVTEIVDTVIDSNKVDVNRATRVVQRAHDQLLDQSLVNEIEAPVTILSGVATVDLTTLTVSRDKIITVWIDEKSILEVDKPIGESDSEVDGLRWSFDVATQILTLNATADTDTPVTIVYIKQPKTLTYPSTDVLEFDMDEILLEGVNLLLNGSGFTAWLNTDGVDQMRDFFGNGARSRSVHSFDIRSFL